MHLETLLLNLVAQAPAAVAVIIVVIKFLAYLKEDRQQRQAEYEVRHRQYYEEIAQREDRLGKVIKDNTEALRNSHGAIERNSVVVQQASQVLAKMNGGSTEGLSK